MSFRSDSHYVNKSPARLTRLVEKNDLQHCNHRLERYILMQRSCEVSRNEMVPEFIPTLVHPFLYPNNRKKKSKKQGRIVGKRLKYLRNLIRKKLIVYVCG